jgi:hypothetical protein
VTVSLSLICYQLWSLATIIGIPGLPLLSSPSCNLKGLTIEGSSSGDKGCSTHAGFHKHKVLGPWSLIRKIKLHKLGSSP